MTNVSPKDSERFHLKLLLNRVKDSTSFEDLRTCNGKTYDTFKEAAIELGLVETDREIYKIFDEAVTIMMPKQLHHFFAFFIMAENSPFSYQI